MPGSETSNVSPGRGFTPLQPGRLSLQGGEEGKIPPAHYGRPRPLGRVVTGFTIIELLVVVAIIALLTSVTIAVLSGARTKSRDAVREEHAKTLQNAFSLYATNTGVYPATDANGVCLDGSDGVSTALIAAGAISSIPRDPRHDCGTTAHYHYTAVGGSTYTLTYYLETDTIPGKSAGQQQAIP